MASSASSPLSLLFHYERFWLWLSSASSPFYLLSVITIFLGYGFFYVLARLSLSLSSLSHYELSWLWLLLRLRLSLFSLSLRAFLAMACFSFLWDSDPWLALVPFTASCENINQKGYGICGAIHLHERQKLWRWIGQMPNLESGRRELSRQCFGAFHRTA
jgi:hypothetical protein